MKCENYRELFSAVLSDDLSPGERTAFEQHLSGCIACQTEFEEAKTTWDLLGTKYAPEPQETMRADFQAMLNEFKENETLAERTGSFWGGLRSLLVPRLAVYPALAVLLCIILLQWYSYRDDVRDLDTLKTEVHEMKESMMLALLDNPSASERLRAVGFTDELKNADSKVVKALLLTLNNDPNVNVRLSTLEALSRLADDPAVRSGLVSSIVQQDSPIMQAAIADVMENLQEKRSIGSFRRLLREKDLDPAVRQKISTTITKLI